MNTLMKIAAFAGTLTAATSATDSVAQSGPRDVCYHSNMATNKVAITYDYEGKSQVDTADLTNSTMILFNGSLVDLKENLKTNILPHDHVKARAMTDFLTARSEMNAYKAREAAKTPKPVIGE